MAESYQFCPSQGIRIIISDGYLQTTHIIQIRNVFDHPATASGKCNDILVGKVLVLEDRDFPISGPKIV
jgi:hypothetical protein